MIRIVLSRLAAMALLLMTLNAPTQAGTEPDASFVIAPDASRFTLDNGLEVVVLPDHRAPVVTHMIWYRVGAADEPAGKSGLAHFLEHLMFKGTTAHPGDAFSRVIADIGGQENAFTSNDYTAYFQRVARQHLGLMMAYEADRMTGLVLSDEVVLPEREVIIEERASRYDNDPGARLGEALTATLYHNHPYGIPIIGWRHEIEQLGREDALAFYERFYTPNNAILVVAGDVTADEVRALAEKTYGQVAPRAEIGPRRRPQEPEPMAERRVVLRDARVQQPSIQIAYLAPSYTTAESGVAPALDVLAQILGGGPTSRLYRTMVIDGTKAASVGAFYQSGGVDDVRFGLYAVPRGAATLEDMERDLNAEVDRLIRDGVTEDELARAKRTVIADAIYAQDSQTSMARIFGSSLVTGEDIGEIQSWPAQIEAVTVDQVRDAARRYLNRQRAVIGLQLPPENPS